jgi:uncharacterized protein
MPQANSTSIALYYAGKNITKYIDNDLLSFSYTDNAGDAADDISITLKDNKGKWIDAWAPEKGDIINPVITAVSYFGGFHETILDCKNFIVDEVSYSGRPRIVTIGAMSAPSDTDFMTTPHSKTWNQASVKKIAETIAKKSGVPLVFDSKVNPLLAFVEQSETPDANFLFDLCKRNGLAMKLFNQKIVVFNEAEYEAKPEIAALTEAGIVTWNCKTTYTDTGYEGCEVKYTNPSTGEVLKYMYYDKNKQLHTVGKAIHKIYRINETVENYQVAQIVAKSKLREMNKGETTVQITMSGNMTFTASQNIILSKDFGRFNGKYYIDKITRSFPDYMMNLELHACLTGY